TMNLASPGAADAIAVVGDEDSSGTDIRRVEYVAAAAVQCSCDDVATIELIAPVNGANVADAERRLLERALALARDNGALKVRVTANALDPPQLRAFVESHGFHFSRTLRSFGTDVAEFYTDLYWTDHHSSRGRQSGAWH
ncbi:MAG TPA: hypothetical protein VNL70_02155, partial [Tepidisphaeraceae bacterium]|nr:hypothetical protein [Tepidisphaeraceae bacterium]